MSHNLVGDHSLVAILRGVKPSEIVPIAEALLSSGVEACEVPLNSPDPFTSIEQLSSQFGDDMLIGAGTVLTTEAVRDAAAAGARYCVSPNTNPAVIKRCVAAQLEPVPGWGSVSEALMAIDAGARTLKLFPAGTYGPAHLRAARAVLPAEITHIAVGGIELSAIDPWRSVGASGFGIGSHLYRPGDTAQHVARRAKAWATALG